MTWKKTDAVFAARVEEASAKTALRLLKKIEEHGKESFAPLAWLLERRFPETFSRPEVQLNFIAQQNVTLNELSINITAAESRAFEARAEPVRESVREKYARYRPGLVEGNGQKVIDVSSEPVTEPSVPEPAAIVRKEGQEKSAAFWAQFCGDPERAVEKSTAIFVAKAITDQTVGRGISNQAIVAFGKSETITVADVLAVIEKLCGGPAGWQLLQKKAGIQPGRGA